MTFCDINLARRLEGAEAASGAGAARALACLRPDSGAAVERIAGGWAMFAGVDSPITQAFCIGLNGPVADDEMDRLEDFFQSRCAAVNIEHCPHADLSVAQHYARRGYVPVEFSNTLYRPLSRGERLEAANAGIDVSPIGPDERKLWTQTVCQGFAELLPVSDELIEIMSCFAFNTAAVCFLARIGGLPAGGGAVCISEGVGVVCGASTLPEFRNRGIQCALLAARLNHAADQGCDLAMTNTLPGSGSQRNVERLGFRVAHSRVKFSKERGRIKG